MHDVDEWHFMHDNIMEDYRYHLEDQTWLLAAQACADTCMLTLVSSSATHSEQLVSPLDANLKASLPPKPAKV